MFGLSESSRLDRAIDLELTFFVVHSLTLIRYQVFFLYAIYRVHFKCQYLREGTSWNDDVWFVWKVSTNIINLDLYIDLGFDLDLKKTFSFHYLVKVTPNSCVSTPITACGGVNNNQCTTLLRSCFSRTHAVGYARTRTRPLAFYRTQKLL